MTDQNQRPTPQQPEFTPEQIDDFFGIIAVTTVRYLIAARRWLKGEGRQDDTTHSLVKQVLDLLVPEILKQAQEIRKQCTVYVTLNLADIYRHYQAAEIRDQTALRRAVAKYLAAWGLLLTPGQLAMLAPERETISKHGGPVQFAQYAFGRLEQVHWKTIHNWTKTLDTLEEEQLLPYGILVTPQEIREVVDTYVEIGAAALSHLEHTYSTTDQAMDAALAEAQRAETLAGEAAGTPTDSERACTSASAKPPRRTIGGPGRPRRQRS